MSSVNVLERLLAMCRVPRLSVGRSSCYTGLVHWSFYRSCEILCFGDALEKLTEASRLVCHSQECF